MADQNQADPDTRSMQQVITQWRKIQEVKRSFVKQGLLNGDATPQQVLDTLRRQIPADLML